MQTCKTLSQKTVLILKVSNWAGVGSVNERIAAGATYSLATMLSFAWTGIASVEYAAVHPERHGKGNGAMGKRAQPERDLQIAVIQHLRARGVPGILFFSVPNGGSRNVREAVNLKRAGALPGVYDLILFRDKKFFALELKVPKTGVMSRAQDAFGLAFYAVGCTPYTAYGLDHALQILELWGFIRPQARAA